MFEFPLIRELTKALYQATGSLLWTTFFFVLTTGVLGFKLYKKLF